MKKIKVKPSARDERGTIVDLLQKENINAVTLVRFNKGAVRGNHFHKKTHQWNYLLSGRIRLRVQSPGGKVSGMVLRSGDFVLTWPGERHALEALETSELMVFTKGPRAGNDYESDTYRLKKPLIKPRSRHKNVGGPAARYKNVNGSAA